MSVDKVKPLKFETDEHGTQNDEWWAELNPNEDYVATKGVAFENSDNHRIETRDNEIAFVDPVNGVVKLQEINSAKWATGAGYLKPLTDGQNVRLYHTDGVQHVILSRTAGNFSITVAGDDAQAFYKNSKKEVSQLGGTSENEWWVVSDSSDGQLAKIRANGTAEINCHTTFEGNVKIKTDSTYAIGEVAIRPTVLFVDRINVNNGSLPDDATRAINLKMAGAGVTGSYKDMDLSGPTGYANYNDIHVDGTSGSAGANAIRNMMYIDTGTYDAGSFVGVYSYINDATDSACSVYGSFNYLYRSASEANTTYGTYNYVNGNANMKEGYGGYFRAINSSANYGIYAEGRTAAVMAKGNIRFSVDSSYHVGQKTVRPKVVWSDRINLNNNGTLNDSAGYLANMKLTGSAGFVTSPRGINLVVDATANALPNKSYGFNISVTNKSQGFFNNAGGAYNNIVCTNNKNASASGPIEIYGLIARAYGQDSNWNSFLKSWAVGLKGYVSSTSDSAYAYGGHFLVESGVDAQEEAAILAENENGGYAVLVKKSGSIQMHINDDGSVKPASIADASAPNDSIYYSTTQSKLVYKDSGGTVNNLY